MWTFDHHPWLKEPHDCKAPDVVGMKSAQVGFTEWLINLSAFTVDIHRRDVLYILPNTVPIVRDFSTGRYDQAIKLSSHMQKMFTDVQNQGHKIAGTTNLYIRGSNSEANMMSLPIGTLLIDEYDACDQDNLKLALQRLRGQVNRKLVLVSTPTLPHHGIHGEYETSTQGRWHFKCPSCSRFIELQFPDNIVIVGESEIDTRIHETHLICDKCKATLHHEDKINFQRDGIYVHEYKDREKPGFHVSQMCAMNLPPSIIAKDYFKAQRDPVDEQVFYNCDLGIPHVVADAQITLPMIQQCLGNYRRTTFNRLLPVTMGVDIGKKIHVEIDLWFPGIQTGYDVNSYAKVKVLNYLELDHFEQLDALMFDYSVNFCVVDSAPDKRKAIEFANRFPGRVKLCRYPVGVNGRNVTLSSEEEVMVNVDRTSWLDLALGRFRTGTIEIPSDTGMNYKNHIMAQVRMPKKDQHGNPISVYVTTGNQQDHWGHARTYAEVAFPFALGLGGNIPTA